MNADQAPLFPDGTPINGFFQTIKTSRRDDSPKPQQSTAQPSHFLKGTPIEGTSFVDLGTLRRGDPPEPPRPASQQEPEPDPIVFLSPSQMCNYEAPPGSMLVGESHIVRGEIFVIGGEAGVGKSRAATALAVSGATMRDWFGLPVHNRFRSLIIQTENSPHRLKKEFDALKEHDIEDWIRVSEPPPFGLTLNNPKFLAAVRAELERFQPDVVIIDPWNAATPDDKQRDYAETFHALRAMLPTGPRKPALGIVAHTRKPQMQAAPGGLGGVTLQHTLSGSHMLASVPRSLFIITRASNDVTDNTVIWHNPKNSNDYKVKETAWLRTEKGFEPLPDFDWEEYERGNGAERGAVTLEHLAEIFENGERWLTLAEAKEALMDVSGLSESAAYKELGKKGKFASHLVRNEKEITFRP